MPSFTLVAGPNGSGKSTLTARIAAAGNISVVDPDAIARELDPIQPTRVAIAAGRESILRCRSLLADGKSFILESTLAGHGAISVLRDAKSAGWGTSLMYLALDNPDLQIDRVRLRASRGGHDVPEADIRRRYGRSLDHAPQAIRLADRAFVLDNTGTEAELMLKFQNGQLTWRANALPQWVHELILQLEN